MDLSRRSDRPEVMDAPDFPPDAYRRCLADLARLNRLTMTHRPTLRWLDAATRDWAPGRAVAVLDVAYGDGDLLRAIHRWATRRRLAPVLAGVDLNPRSAEVAAAATPPEVAIAWHTGDVFAYQPDPATDFIVSSQFLHHLGDAAAAACVARIDRHARRGWFVVDLHRHAVPYYGFRVLARAMGWHEVVRTDGTISIARGFSRAEWAAMIRASGVAGAVLRWEIPFRLTAGLLR
jgi:SAM-dependent methyltransferase